MKNASTSLKRFAISSHAGKMLRERGIREEWVRQVLHSPSELKPDKEDLDLQHALKRIPDFGNRVLRVIYNKTMNPQLVVTAFFDRKAGRKP